MIILFLIAGPFVPLFAWIACRRWLWGRPKPKARHVERCRCGYPLDELDTVRCPECGRVRDFDATAQELGLTVEQLKLAKTKRDARLLDPFA